MTTKKILVKQLDVNAWQQVANVLNNPQQWNVMNFAQIIQMMDNVKPIEVEVEVEEPQLVAPEKSSVEG